MQQRSGGSNPKHPADQSRAELRTQDDYIIICNEMKTSHSFSNDKRQKKQAEHSVFCFLQAISYTKIWVKV